MDASGYALGRYGDGTDVPVGSSVMIGDGAWHYLELCVDPSAAGYLFVDGALAGSSTTSTAFNFSSAGDRFGVRLLPFGASASGLTWPGDVDEVACYAGVRHAASYAPPTAPTSENEANLLAVYHLNGDGTDSLGSGQQGGGVKFNASATDKQYFNAPDSAALTFPNGNWCVGAIVNFNGRDTGSPSQYILSTGGFGASGSLQIAWAGASNSVPNKIVVYVDSTANAAVPDAVSLDTFSPGVSGAHLIVVQRSGTTLTVRTCPVLSQSPADGVAVRSGPNGSLGKALDGPSGLFIGGRADLADRWCDQTLSRIFRLDGTLTDLEVAKLAYGMEITGLGKAPAWYFRLNDPADTSDRGAQGNSLVLHGAPTAAEAPSFGYVPAAANAIDVAPPAERIFQRIGGAANVALLGTYSGTAPTTLDFQLYADDGITIFQSWTALPNPVISNGTWTSTPSIPQGGMYRIAVRSNGGALATSSVKGGQFGVGDLIGCIGSSSAEKWFDSSSGSGFTAAANVRKFNENGWSKFGADGCAIAMVNAFAQQSGVPIGMLDYGIGGDTLANWLNTSNASWNAFRSGVIATGSKLAAVISSMGSNDAANNLVASRAGHLANLRQLVENLRTLTGQSALPVLISGFNRRLNLDANQCNYVRMAENDAGFDPGVYNVQTLDFELSGDGTHLTPSGFTLCAARTSSVFGRILYGDGVYRRGPRVIGMSASGKAVTVSLQHRGASDFSPASGITGFSISDASGAPSITAVRSSATTIVITTDRVLAAPIKTQYLAGAAPAVGTQVFDNGSTSLPLHVETDLETTQAGTSVAADLNCIYAVRAAVSSDLACAYAVRGAVSRDLVAGYSVRARIQADLACSYAVLSGGGAPALTPVSSDLACAYSVRASVVRDQVFAYGVRERVSRDLACTYSIQVAGGQGPSPVPDASKIPTSRVVVFAGGTRVVTFEGGIRTVRF